MKISLTIKNNFLRIICEVAFYPESEDGVLGELFNLLLSPTDDLEDFSDIDEFGK